MKLWRVAALASTCALLVHAETAQERGKRLINECLQALDRDPGKRA